MISAFDAQFIMQYLHTQSKIKPELLTRGMQIIQLEALDVTLLDSLNYLPFALSNFPAAFGLQESKGYFPHLFNTEENWDYSGDLPDAWCVSRVIKF